MIKAETRVLQANTVDERDGVESHSDDGEDSTREESGNLIRGRKRKLFELRLKMNEARKANQSAMVVEKKKTEAPTAECRGMSKYGKAPKSSDDKIERMVKELKDRDEKHQSFSRRRKFHEEKDIDSINDRNEHFNKKIERAFGKYTLEIKNNLERGTALPD